MFFFIYFFNLIPFFIPGQIQENAHLLLIIICKNNFIQKSQLAKVDVWMEESAWNQKKKPAGMSASVPIDIMDEAVQSYDLSRTVW